MRTAGVRAHEQGRESADRQTQVEAPQRSEASGRAAALLGLQRTIGNRRVVQRAQRRAAPTRDPATIDAAARHGTRGPGGPLPFLAQIQRSFGHHDVSHLQAHTGPTAAEGARAMDAVAFAAGDHVAFAQRPTLHLAAHEAAHVIQQRGGVQLKSGVGEVGDVHERHADEVADRVTRGESAEALLDTYRPQATASTGAVQRSVGFEIELRESDWKIWTGDPKNKQAPEKGTPIIRGKDFELQAEYAGDGKAIAELVTDPPGLTTRGEFEASMGDMVRLGEELDAQDRDQQYFESKDFKGGVAGFTLEKVGAAIDSASMQITAGVPLASMETLFNQLAGIMVGDAASYTKPIARARDVGSQTGRNGLEMRGFTILLQEYLLQAHGGGKDKQQNFIKGMIKVMARTDFHAMFKALPDDDRNYIINNTEAWIGHMLAGDKLGLFQGRAASMDPDEPLVGPKIHDAASTDPRLRLRTSRKKWLANLQHKDLLSSPDQDDSDIDVIHQEKTLSEYNEDLRRAKTMEEQELIIKQATSLKLDEPPKETPKPLKEEFDPKAAAAIVKNLLLGLGSLKDATDFVHYNADVVAENAEVNAENYTAAPIIEIRNPPVAGRVNNWLAVATRIYDAIDYAIRKPGGKYSRSKPYENVLSVKQQEMRDKYRGTDK